jgi:hypothetical protein
VDWLWIALIVVAVVAIGAGLAWLFRPELDNDEEPVRDGRRRLRRLRRASGRRKPNDSIDP